MAVPSGVICLWPSTVASIPAGWTRETALDARYIRGAAAAADADLVTDLGNTTHTHTSPGHTPTQPTHIHPVSGAEFTPLERDKGPMPFNLEPVASIHSHAQKDSDSFAATTQSATITVDAASNDLAFVEAIYIKSDGTPVGIPVGAYAMFASDSLPSLWVRVHGDRYPKGAAAGLDGGGVGGSNTHLHTSPGHTHVANAHQGTGTTFASSGATNNIHIPDVVDYSTGPHTHTYTFIAKTQTIQSVTITIASGNGEPTFKKLNIIRNDNASADLPTSIIALWGGSHSGIPAGWARFTSMDDKFLKGAAANGESDVTTGGGTQHLHTASSCAPVVDSHNHTGLTGVASSPTTLATDVNTPGSNARGAQDNHVHTWSIGLDGGLTHNAVAVTIDNSTAEAAFPKYRRVIFINFVTAVVEKVPFARTAILAGILATWQAGAPNPQVSPKLIQAEAAAEAQVPFTRPWLPAVLESWQAEPAAVRLPRVTPPASVDDPPFGQKSWLGTIIGSWAPPQPPSQGAHFQPPPSIDNPPFAMRAWRSGILESWRPADPIAPRRRLQQFEAFPVAPPPVPEEICFPRIETPVTGFTRVVAVAATYSRGAPSGSYSREGPLAFSGTRMAAPGSPFARLEPPDCAPPIGYGDDYGFEYGGE